METNREQGESPNELRLSKRTFLITAGLIPVAALTGSAFGQTSVGRAGAARRPIPGPGAIDVLFNSLKTCVLSPQSVEGPFYFEHKLIRSDIREDQQGTLLTLNFDVIDANDCKPVEDALVSVWQCNVFGYYSGYTFSNPEVAVPPADALIRVPHQDPRTPERWLRGAVRADKQGRATFRTIVPGWYLPRAPHIHVKVFLKGGAEIITTQFYFPQSLLDNVLHKGVYAKRGAGHVTNEIDFVRRQSGGLGPTFEIGVDADGNYVAHGVLGIAHV